MAGWIAHLVDFFEGLFSPDPQALRVRRQLRELGEVLEEVRPPIWSGRTGQILPGFAQGWGTVHQQLQPLRHLFDKTLNHSDPGVQDQCLHYLVESLLGGELADRRRNLSFDALQARLGRSTDSGLEMAQISAEFNSLLMDLRRQDSEALQRDFEGLLRLKALAAHPLVPLLVRFGYEAASATQTWRAAEGDSLLPLLLDLYFVADGLEVSPGTERMLGLLLEKAGPAQAAENRRKTAAVLVRLRDLSRGPCSHARLLQLIKVVARDPDLAAEVQRFPERPIQVYAGQLSERFTRDRDRALREAGESSVELEIRELFPDAPLLTLARHNAEASRRLVEAGLPALEAVVPLQVLKSFAFAVLQAGYLDAVKRIVLEGHPVEKDWGQSLAAALDAVTGLAERLEAFDAEFPSLDKYVSGRPGAAAPGRAVVERLNRASRSFLEGEGRLLSVLAVRVQELLTDYRAPQPRNVANLKAIGGAGQRALVEALIRGYNKTALLLRILKRFVVVR